MRVLLFQMVKLCTVGHQRTLKHTVDKVDDNTSYWSTRLLSMVTQTRKHTYTHIITQNYNYKLIYNYLPTQCAQTIIYTAEHSRCRDRKKYYTGFFLPNMKDLSLSLSPFQQTFISFRSPSTLLCTSFSHTLRRSLSQTLTKTLSFKPSIRSLSFSRSPPQTSLHGVTVMN